MPITRQISRVLSCLFFFAAALLTPTLGMGQACHVEPNLVCQVSLLYRPVIKGGVYLANHTFWYQLVFDSNYGTYVTDSVVDGGPSTPGCFNGNVNTASTNCWLKGWENLGSQGYYKEDNTTTAYVYGQTDVGSEECQPAGAIDSFPDLWNARLRLPYILDPVHNVYQNSNSFTHYAGDFGGLVVPGTPPQATGW